MKSTKIWRSYIKVETVFCPYCGYEDSVPEEFQQVENEDDFEIKHTCDACGKKYKINWIKEN